MQRAIVFAAVSCVLTPCLLTAAPLTYQFEGKVISAAFMPYGLQVSNSNQVIGQFTYDPASAATHQFSTGVGYDQHFTNGFWATIGSVTVSADEYVVIVSNNAPQPGGTVSDSLSITFSSALNPALTSPLTVDGIPHSAGLFALNFTGSSNLYANTSLPSSIQLSEFPTSFNFLSDTPTGNLDVLFSVTSLTKVPEPSAVLLLLLGTIFLIRGRRYSGLHSGSSK